LAILSEGKGQQQAVTASLPAGRQENRLSFSLPLSFGQAKESGMKQGGGPRSPLLVFHPTTEAMITCRCW
jgi:hypothetical protein